MKTPAHSLASVLVLMFVLASVSCSESKTGDLEEAQAAYERGEYAVALKEFRLLARSTGNAEAQLNLGEMYFLGRGVAQDYAKARFWYLNAAKTGMAEAQYRLGVMYAKGHGVRPDEAKAASWYRLAAQQDHALAQRSLDPLRHATAQQ